MLVKYNGRKTYVDIGIETEIVNQITKLNIPNTSKVLCHGQISAAVCGSTVYIWGLVNPEELESSARNL